MLQLLCQERRYDATATVPGEEIWCYSYCAGRGDMTLQLPCRERRYDATATMPGDEI